MLTRLRSIFRRFAVPKAVTAEEVEGVIRLPVLSVIPHLERRRDNNPALKNLRKQIKLDGRWFSRLLIHFPVDIPAAAAYATLVQDLRVAAERDRKRVVVLLSPMPGEGTSLTAVNLAIAAKRRGVKALVVEGDLRAPRISSVLNLPLDPGVTGVLSKGIALEDAIRACPLTGIEILPAGRSIPYPGALWSDPGFERMLISLRGMYELIFFEAGSLLLYPDTPSIAARGDTTILVHQFGRGSEERIQRAVEKLGAARDKVIGVVLNDVPGGWTLDAD